MYKNKKLLQKKQKGFTLIEMIVSIFVFVLIMLAIVEVFASQIRAHKNARTLQSDLENAQFAMNYIGKTLRTATLVGYGASSGSTNSSFIQPGDVGYEEDFYTKTIAADSNEGLILYDFSQEACIIFTFGNDSFGNYGHPALWMESQTGTVGINEIEKCLDQANWHAPGGSGYKKQRLTTGVVHGTILAAPTRYQDHLGSRGTDTIGRVTVAMKIEPAVGANTDSLKPSYIETTVSLRDYPSDLSF